MPTTVTQCISSSEYTIRCSRCRGNAHVLLRRDAKLMDNYRDFMKRKAEFDATHAACKEAP